MHTLIVCLRPLILCTLFFILGVLVLIGFAHFVVLALWVLKDTLCLSHSNTRCHSAAPMMMI